MFVRIIIADDHPVTRVGVEAMLRCDPSLAVVACTGDGPSTVACCRRLRPDLLLVALRLPQLSGLGVSRILSSDNSHPRVLVYGSTADSATVRAALDAGASGYMYTGTDTPELLAGVHAVLAGRQMLLGVGANISEMSRLGSQELVILQEVARGLGNKEIAQLHGISVRTVGTHLSNIFDKLGVHNRTTAVARARQHGYLAIEKVPATTPAAYCYRRAHEPDV